MRDRYLATPTFDQSITGAVNEALWRAVYRLARAPEEYAARVRALGGAWHLLVLSEVWCGDSVNTLPALARLTEGAPNIDLRIIERDRNPDLMDTHLTNGSRSIPIVMVLDAHYVERGSWGPRPSVLQEWVMTEGTLIAKEERYPKIRAWYARDRGRSTLEEVVSLLEAAAGVEVTPHA
ncbi:MAG: thioredoxin family protein [Gemmatimonadaceae bacterium]